MGAKQGVADKMATQQPWTGIEISTSFYPLSFFLYLCTPTIIIDGEMTRRPWGIHTFPLAGGMHQVRIYCPYMLMQTCGDASINVVVQPNCIHRIVFDMPMFMFSSGTIREIPPYRFQ
jgi:hypothetical protein